MSELIRARGTYSSIRRTLMLTASTGALLALFGLPGAAQADSDAQPMVWIELGGQMDHISGQGDPFAPDFLSANPDSSVLASLTPVQAQRPAPFDFGWEGKISLEPHDSDWRFTAAVKYGRSSNLQIVDHQTHGVHYQKYRSGAPVPSFGMFTQADFAKTKSHRQQSHAILDFQAGKDLGLGMFGRESSSVFSLGIRFAQFASKQNFDIRARPDLHFKYTPSAAAPTHLLEPYFHTYHASGSAARSFRGIGPSLSWSASTPFLGDPRDGELAFDWGANAAVLFGRQKMHMAHQQTGHYWPKSGLGLYSNAVAVTPTGDARGESRSVIVPNVGGFAGASWRIEDFKASIGYRADFFFGAMDVGVDARKSKNAAFYGPFASISVGLP